MSDDQQATDAIAWDWVAALYDTYVTVTFDLPFWLRQTASVRGGDVLELMCGTGRVTLPLARAGRRVTAVDASAGMLARLREKLAEQPDLAASVQAVQQDVRTLDLARQFPLVLLPFQSFAELVTPEDQRRALARIYRHVSDGGRFICTLHNPALRRATLDGQLRLVGRFPHSEASGTLLLWSWATYSAETRLAEGIQLYEEYDAAATLQRKRMLPIRFALLERDQFEALASAAGFRVVALYGDYDGGPFEPDRSPFMLWTLAK
jgi:SAM-dependent methyltransferase